MKHKIKTDKSKWKIKQIEGKIIKKRYNKRTQEKYEAEETNFYAQSEI